MSSLLRTPGPRYAALLQLLRTAESLWESSRVFFTQWDLSPSQFNVINLLRDRSEGMSQTQLSRELIMHRSNVTGLVDRLEQKELVERRADPKDRRAHRVVLTRSGKTLVRQILPHYYQAAEDALGHLPARAAEKLVKDLDRVSKNAEELTENNTRKGNG